MVLAPDGKEYGPASIDTLKEWAADNRLAPGSQLRDFHTGQVVTAASVREIFPPKAVETVAPPPTAGEWAQPPSASNYTRPMPNYVTEDNGMGDVWGALARSGLAILFFFVLHGFGIVFAGYGVYYAIQAQAKGHKLGWLALVIAGVTFLVIGVGWLFRLGAI